MCCLTPRLDSRENFDPLPDRFNRVNVEFFFLTRLNNFLPQHQPPDVLCRHQNPLPPRKTACFAAVIEALDLQVYSSARLYFSLLVDGARCCQGSRPRGVRQAWE